VVAMMAFVIDQPQPYLRTEIGQVGWVAELVVDERYRGQGIGTLMLEEAERRARQSGLKRLMIGAIAGNHIARKAYERFGFRPAVIELAKELD
jgi:GNAT superfamily N-acetyltransferase